MPQKPTCYISYAWSDEILNFLLRLKSDIEKRSQNKIKVILDPNYSKEKNFQKDSLHSLDLQ